MTRKAIVKSNRIPKSIRKTIRKPQKKLNNAVGVYLKHVRLSNLCFAKNGKACKSLMRVQYRILPFRTNEF